MASEVSALESPRVLTLPDVRVALWIKLEIEPALLLKNGRKPRIVAPVRFHDHRIVWLLLAQKFIDGVLLPAGGPVCPQLRSFLSDRGARLLTSNGPPLTSSGPKCTSGAPRMASRLRIRFVAMSCAS